MPFDILTPCRISCSVFSILNRFWLTAPACLAVLGATAATRAPNTTLTLPSSPPQSGYATTPAFGSLTFTNPCVIATPPGETNRLFVVEQRGTIAVITNLAAPTRATFLNIIPQVVGGVPTDERGLLGLAFHPGYATNGYFFIFYSSTSTPTTNLNGTVNTGLHQCLSRFSVLPGDVNAADPASELRLLVLPDDYGNHNGGCLQFGADGYLYVSTGDEGDANDTGQNSQRIDKDLWAGMLRLDVDLLPGNPTPTAHAAQRFTGWNGVVNYRIPADNPFLGATSFNGIAIDTNLLRAEFWATGLRNPWRFSFDPLDGKLYLGDVGQGALEEIDLVTAGGNYGWAYREGNIARPGSPVPPPGFTNAIEPIITYTRGSGTNQGTAVTGGVVYRGNRFPSLYGKYIFADYVSGRIWAAQPDGTNVVPFHLLATDANISAFGTDPRNGDVLLCDQNDDTIKRLVTVSNITGSVTLSGTGAFTNLTTLTPHAGILPYEINVPFWSDNATKTRWFSVPNTNLTMTFSPEGNWLFPTGSVWIKHFDLETNTTTHASRRLETRFIVRYTNGVYGLTYRWTIPPTNALLVAEEGFDEPVAINDNGNVRTQMWHYPSRGECLSCHSVAGGGVLGFDTLQLNRVVTNGGAVNQIQFLSAAGYLSAPVGEVNSLRSLAHATNEAASLEWRARSYLKANCSFCHQPGGTVASWDGRLTTPTRFANIVNGVPFNNLGSPSNRIIVPGDTNLSLIHARMSTRSPGAMPPLASSIVDTNGVALLARWIATDLTNYQTYAEWQVAKFGSTNAPNSGEQEDYDSDGAKNYLEYLTGTDPLLSMSGWGLAITAGASNAMNISWEQTANRSVELQWRTNLESGDWEFFDAAVNQPFYPASNRVQQVVLPAEGTNSLFFRARVSEP